MKSMSNFEAFKMNKVQMNAIAGGVTCTINFEEGDPYILLEVYPGMSPSEAEDSLTASYKDCPGFINVSCS